MYIHLPFISFQELVLILSIVDAYGCGKQSAMVPPTACPDVRCKSESKPICASNGETYGNQCLLDAAICEAKRNGAHLETLHDGPCLPTCYECPSSVYDNVGQPTTQDTSHHIAGHEKTDLY